MKPFAGPSVHQRSASDYLQDNNWFQLAQKHLSGEGATVFQEPTDIARQRANDLASNLVVRFERHIEKRIPAEKRNNFSLDFVRENISRLAALAVASKHSIESFEFVGLESSLLSPNISAFFDYNVAKAANGSSPSAAVGLVSPTGPADSAKPKGKGKAAAKPSAAVQETESPKGCFTFNGSYIFYDKIRGCFVRSGKVIGRSPVARYVEHKAASETDATLFYASYPGRKAPRSALAKGYFEHLSLHAGLVFKIGDEEAKTALCSADDKKGLLYWSPTVMSKVTKDKQLHMVGYLFEMLYDLMIAPNANVSQSPGFESFLHIYGGGP